MGVLLEEVVLHHPRVVDSESIGQLDLLKGILQYPMLVVGAPGTGLGMLKKYAELHDASSIERISSAGTAGLILFPAVPIRSGGSHSQSATSPEEAGAGLVEDLD